MKHLPSSNEIPFFVFTGNRLRTRHQAYSNCAFSSTTPLFVCSVYSVWNFWRYKKCTVNFFWQKLKRIRAGLRFCRPLCEAAIIMNKGTHFRFLKSNYSKRKTVLMEWVTSCTGLKRVRDRVILIRIASVNEMKWRTRKNVIHYINWAFF